MAKIDPKNIYLPGRRNAVLPRNVFWRKLRSDVRVIRTGASGRGGRAFEACIQIGGMPAGYKANAPKKTSYFSNHCNFGKNPREAIAKTLEGAARHMRKRSGAFARYR